MQLEHIQTLLEEDGFLTSLERAGPGSPIDQLVAVLELEDERGSLALQLALLPDEGADIENASLLQFYAGLPVEVGSAAALEVYRVLGRINRSVPLGAFHFHDEAGVVYFRHVSPLPRGEDPAMGPVILETVWLCDYILDSALDAVAAVGAGDRTAEAAWPPPDTPGDN